MLVQFGALRLILNGQCPLNKKLRRAPQLLFFVAKSRFLLYDVRASEEGVTMDHGLLTQHKFKQHGKETNQTN